MTEHMCQHNPMLYTTFWPLPAFRAQSNRGEFQTKANFRSLHQILHFSSLFITIASSPFCSGHRRHIRTKANFHPVQQESYTIHHFSSLLDDVVPQIKPNFHPRSPYDAWSMPSIFDI